MHFQSKLARNGSTASEDSSTFGLNDVMSNGNSGSDDTTTPQTSSSLQTPRGVSDDEFVLDRSVPTVLRVCAHLQEPIAIANVHEWVYLRH